MARSSMATTLSKTRRPFGKPARSPPRMPLMFGLGRRRDRHVQPQHVGLGRAGEVLEARDQPGRDAGQQDRQQVGPVGRVARRGSGTRPGTAPAAAWPAPAGRRTWRTRSRRPARSGSSWSFAPIGTMTSLNSGLPSRETCTNGPTSHGAGRRRGSGPSAGEAEAHTPITDLGAVDVRGHDAVAGSAADRHLDGDACAR